MLENPEHLVSIGYEELKTMALAYPYAQNLRYLLALKSKQINHPEYTRNLAAAAAHSIDRKKLFYLVADRIVLLREEILELKPIETVKKTLESMHPVSRTDATVEKQGPEEQLAAVVPHPPVADDQTAFDLSDARSYLMPPDSGFGERLAPAPVTRPADPPVFESWVNGFNLPLLAEKPKRVSAAPPAPKSAQALAERSVTVNKDLVSEPLAKLYALQGHREKAIDIYERLILIFPEKSATFAAEIEKLKK